MDSSSPVMGLTPRLPARRANSRAQHRLASVMARAPVAVLDGLGQQLVDVGGPRPERIEALGVELHLTGGHGRPCALRGLPGPALLALVPEPGHLPAVRPAHPVIGSGQGLGHPPQVEAVND